MVIKIRQILFYLLKKVVPELAVLKRNISWRFYEDYIGNSYVSKKTKINSPCNLSNVVVGEYTYIDQNARITETSIGKFCSIGPNFFCGWGIHPLDGISTAPMFYSVQKQNGVTLVEQNKIQERKKIYIGNDVFIGANVTVLDGVTIGDGAVIGAGAIVSKDIPPYAVAVGSPIQIIKYRFKPEQINALLNISWWNFPEEQLKDVKAMFFDLDAFIKKYAK